MDVFVQTRFLLTWIVLSSLLSWMVICAWLALRPERRTRVIIEHQYQERHISARTVPGTSAPVLAQTMATPPIQMQVYSKTNNHTDDVPLEQPLLASNQ